MNNYAATVVQIDNIHPHPNADRLACTNIFGNNVIIGKDTKIGDVGLYFPIESQLGLEFATVNDLIRKKNPDGSYNKGYFDNNRRVRAQTLRGEKSMGFFCPLSYLTKLPPKEGNILFPSVGKELENWNGFDISKKYIVPTKVQPGGNKKGNKAKKESRVIPEQFHFHFDTAQLGKNINKIQPEDLISITWKMHGSSGICGNVLVKKRLSLTEKILKKLGVNVVDTEYDYIYSSRRVIKNQETNSHFYDSDVWTEAGTLFSSHLHKGETVYYELVGYTSSGQEIQKGYDYGCEKNQFKIYIYRITQTNVDGIVTELPWHQVKHRAVELGFDKVPEIYYGKAGLCIPGICGGESWNKDFLNGLQKRYVYDQDSQFCRNKVPEEGIVVRKERGDGIESFKLKSFRFLQHESKQLDKGEVDMESGESL